MTITTEQLDELERKATGAQVASPGPYRVDWADDERHCIDFICDARGDVVVEADSGVHNPRGVVAEHITANSPDVTLRLVAVYRAALALVGPARISYAQMQEFNDLIRAVRGTP